MLPGILFVLYTGIGWEGLPQELGFGSGMTCWRRLRDWQDAGVCDRLHELLLAELSAAAVIDWFRVCVDTSHVGAKGITDRPHLIGEGRDRLEDSRDLQLSWHPTGGGSVGGQHP